MSSFDIDCGHTVDGHDIVWITGEGVKAFRIWKKGYGRKLLCKTIAKRGGNFEGKYITTKNDKIDPDERSICSSCLREWQDCRY